MNSSIMLCILVSWCITALSCSMRQRCAEKASPYFTQTLQENMPMLAVVHYAGVATKIEKN